MTRRAHRLLTVLTVASLTAAWVPLADAYTGTGTAFPVVIVDNGSGAQSDPRVSGDFAVYTDDQGGLTSRIEYYDFSHNPTRPTRASVPTVANAIDFLPDVDGANIVFTRLSAAGSSIYEYSIANGVATEVAPVVAPERRNPAIGGPTIAWEESGFAGATEPEIVVASAGTSMRLTNDTLGDRNPNAAPDGQSIVWEKCASTCDVYMSAFAGGSWATTSLAATAADEIWPDTNGTQVVYASNAGGSYHVYVTNGAMPSRLVVPGSVAENHPAIAGSFVAFEASDGVQTDIWLYDVRTNVAQRVTDTPESEVVADLTDTTLSGTEVTLVWQVIESNSNVYGSFLSRINPVTGHFLQPLTESDDPANPVLNTGKNGKVIPVKVRLTEGGAATTSSNAPGPVTIGVSRLASCSTAGGTDPVETYADAGESSAGTNQFRYDPGTETWVYNLDTKALGLITGNCYRIDVSVAGGQLGNAFAVFQPVK